MNRIIAATLVLLLGTAQVVSAQGVSLGKHVDLGPLAEYFVLVNGNAKNTAFGMGQVNDASITITLELKAKKAVNTAELDFLVGVFDKEKVLMEAGALQLVDRFPLLKGESTYAQCKLQRLTLPAEGLPWHMLYVRAPQKSK